MHGTIILKPVSPTNAKPTPGRGMYGAGRWYGSHKGQDFLSNWGDEVLATEDGVVVFSDMIEGSEKRTRYGETVVIDHTPMASKNERHIYTLSAHLNARRVRTGLNVKKEQVIGTSGNSGTKEYYVGKKKGTTRGKEGGFHLHFEVIDSPHELEWTRGRFPSGYSKSPIDFYIRHIITIEYALGAEVMSRIQGQLDFDPHMDFKGDSWWMDVSLGGKKVGRIDRDTLEVRLSLSPEELEGLL